MSIEGRTNRRAPERDFALNNRTDEIRAILSWLRYGLDGRCGVSLIRETHDHSAV